MAAHQGRPRSASCSRRRERHPDSIRPLQIAKEKENGHAGIVALQCVQFQKKWYATRTHKLTAFCGTSLRNITSTPPAAECSPARALPRVGLGVPFGVRVGPAAPLTRPPIEKLEAEQLQGEQGKAVFHRRKAVLYTQESSLSLRSDLSPHRVLERPTCVQSVHAGDHVTKLLVPERTCIRAGWIDDAWVSMLLLEWLRNAAEPPGSRTYSSSG